VISLKKKTKLNAKRASQVLSFFGLAKKNKLNQAEIDRKLVYTLSARKIPNGGQIRHLNKFLNPKENLIIKICALFILVNAVYLGITFFQKHLQYAPVAGGEYIEGIVGYPKIVNPLYAVNRDVDSDLSSLVYSSLFKYDQSGALVNDLAETVSISNDKEYTIKIKDGAVWQNGDKLTVDDIIFTISAIQNADYHSPLRASLSSVETAKIDEQTLKITLGAPYAPFLEVLTFGILPKNIWENVNPSSVASSDMNLKPIGSGQYKFKSFLKNKDGDIKEYNLVFNNSYYGRKPFISAVKFKFFNDYTEATKALNDNQIDGLGYLPFDERKDLVAKNALTFNELLRPQIVALFFNSGNDKALADKTVRVSLAQAIDKDQIIKDVFSDVYKRADGPILSTSYAYDDAIAKYAYSPLEAETNIKNKLASTTLTVIDSGTNVAVAEAVKAYWEKIGVAVEIKVVPGEQAADIIKNRAFEILLYGESVGGDPDVYAFWHSSQIGAKGLNLASYNNQEVDKLLADARATTDIATRIEKYKKFQEDVVNDVPAIFLYSPTYTYVQSKKLKGFNGSMVIEPDNRFASIADWYLKTSKKLVW